MFQHRLHDTAIIAHKITELTDMISIKSNPVHCNLQLLHFVKKNCTILLYLLSTIILFADLVSICDQFFETSRERRKSS